MSRRQGADGKKQLQEADGKEQEARIRWQRAGGKEQEAKMK